MRFKAPAGSGDGVSAVELVAAAAAGGRRDCARAGRGAASSTGAGALVGVPELVEAGVLLAAGATAVTAGAATIAQALNSNHSFSTGSGGQPPSSQVNVGGQPWRRFNVGDKACQDGCKEVAEQIQKSIGGKIHHVTPPRGAPFMGGVANAPGGKFKNPIGSVGASKRYGWSEHYVVVKDGRVYDALTGPAGEAIDAYKARWEFADVIDFGF